MAQFTIQGKIHQKPSNGQYAMEFVLIEEIRYKDKSYHNYLPFTLKKNDKSEYNIKLQGILSELNIGDEIEITVQPRGDAGKDKYVGKYFLRLEPSIIKVIKKLQIKQELSEDKDNDCPF